MPKIIITSPDQHGKTRGAINGETFEVKHNEAVEVSDEQLEVIQRADLGVAKVAVQPDKVEAASDASDTIPAAAIGTELAQDPATPAATDEGGNTLLGDHTDAQGGDTGKAGKDKATDADKTDDSKGDKPSTDPNHELGDTSGDKPAAKKPAAKKPAAKKA